jgi:flagellar assembly factor FliW
MSDKNTYDVKMPILGFEKLESVSIIPIDDIFYRLYDSKDLNSPIFLLADANKIKEYDFELGVEARTMLQLSITSKTELSVYAIIVQNEDITNSTINFIAPIIVNEENNILIQLVLDSKKYPEFQIDEKLSKYMNK